MRISSLGLISNSGFLNDGGGEGPLYSFPSPLTSSVYALEHIAISAHSKDFDQGVAMHGCGVEHPGEARDGCDDAEREEQVI
jgi:hypothetical protein